MILPRTGELLATVTRTDAKTSGNLAARSQGAVKTPPMEWGLAVEAMEARLEEEDHLSEDAHHLHQGMKTWGTIFQELVTDVWEGMAASVQIPRHNIAFVNSSKWDTVTSRGENQHMNDSALGIKGSEDPELVVRVRVSRVWGPVDFVVDIYLTMDIPTTATGMGDAEIEGEIDTEEIDMEEDGHDEIHMSPGNRTGFFRGLFSACREFR